MITWHAYDLRTNTALAELMFAVDTGGGSGSAPYSAYTSVLVIPT